MNSVMLQTLLLIMQFLCIGVVIYMVLSMKKIKIILEEKNNEINNLIIQNTKLQKEVFKKGLIELNTINKNLENLNTNVKDGFDDLGKFEELK